MDLHGTSLIVWNGRKCEVYSIPKDDGSDSGEPTMLGEWKWMDWLHLSSILFHKYIYFYLDLVINDVVFFVFSTYWRFDCEKN